ncbi:MAG: baseplate J/gp47 family protein [Oligoflexales bacterium]
MRPSLKEINASIHADLGQTGVRHNLKSIFAKGIAGLTHSLYAYVDTQIEGRMPDTARKDILERWAKIWGYQRNPASFARGLIVVKASEDLKLEQGTAWLHESEHEYCLKEDTFLEAGVNEIELSCVKTGTRGNRHKGELLTISNTIAGLDSEATVLSMEGGYEEENDNSLRRRFLRRLALPPQGGAVHDYIDWAESLPQVFKAWIDPLPGEKLGCVALTFLTPDIANPIPSKEQAQNVHLELEKIKPAGSRLVITPPIKKEVSIKVTKLDPPQIFPKVEQLIKDVFQSKMAPSGYLDAMQNEQVAKVTPYDIFLAVSQIEGLKEIEFTPKETMRAENKVEILVLKEVQYEGNL